MDGKTSPPDGENLRRSVGFSGVLGQSVAGVAPSTTPTINLALVFVAAGSASWFVYSIALVAILLVAFNLVPLAQKFAGAGSLSEFVGHGLGAFWRLVTAWALLLGYLTISVATLAACAGYLSTLFGWAGLSLPVIVWVALAGSLAVIFTLRDIRLSTGLMLGLEITSVLLVIALGLTILVRQGVAADLSQFDLKGLTPSGMSNGLLIGVLSFVGFEAAASLGSEAKRPLRDIPRALILTPVLTGLFFVFSAYVIVLGFNRYGIPVATSNAPLDALARALHRPGLGVLVALGASISLFAGAMAALVTASRLLFALARQGAVPELFGRVGGKHAAPRWAVGFAAALILITSLGLAIAAKPLDIYDWMGTFGTFGCVLAYGLTCVATPIFLYREKRLKVRHVTVSLLALVVLGYVLFGSVYPVPPAPMNFLPWLFTGLLVVGVVFSIAFRSASAIELGEGSQ